MAVATPARAAISSDDLREIVLARLLEKHDPAKARHKPLSILRPELRRMTEQMLEQEAGALGLDLRDTLVEEILLEVPGAGPLEDLFHDESLNEFMVLSPTQVIRRTEQGWTPTNVQFRDNNHLRRSLKKLLETSVPIGDVPTTSDGAADAMLPNGFRMLAVLPPRVMEMSATAVFRRPLNMPAPQPTPIPQRPLRMSEPSGAVSFNTLLAPGGSNASNGSNGSRNQGSGDAAERLRQRVTQHFVERLASKGVFDLSLIPESELRYVLTQYVTEFNETDKLHLDSSARERLTAEILTGMQR